jgi:hypothetical protein
MRSIVFAASALALLAFSVSASAAGSAGTTTDLSSQITIDPGRRGGPSVTFGDPDRRDYRRDRRRCVTETVERVRPSGRVVRERRTVCR